MSPPRYRRRFHIDSPLGLAAVTLLAALLMTAAVCTFTPKYAHGATPGFTYTVATKARTPSGITFTVTHVNWRRRYIPGRTLDSLFALTVPMTSCRAVVWKGPPYTGWFCPQPFTTAVGKDYLYEVSWCDDASHCTGWGAMERVWCAPMVGVSGGQGCPCSLFASEAGCIP